MSDELYAKTPKWFWVIAIVALLWNLMGVFAYIAQVSMTVEMLNELPADQQELILNTPAWATGAFAFAVWGGAIGSLLLLLKRKMAQLFFIISFAGVLVQLYHSFFMSNSIEVYGPGGMVMPVMILIFCVFLIWFTSSSAKKGWIS